MRSGQRDPGATLESSKRHDAVQYTGRVRLSCLRSPTCASRPASTHSCVLLRCVHFCDYPSLHATCTLSKQSPFCFNRIHVGITATVIFLILFSESR